MRDSSLTLNDRDIRDALLHNLTSQFSQKPETLVLEELGLRHGLARIDIAIINSSIDGIEIKSDLDTLERLPTQMRVYNSVLDHVTLVVGYSHLNQVLLLVPEWWGLQIAEATSPKDVRFLSVREPRSNPALDMLSVAKLLWRDEALSLLRDLDAADGFLSKPRAAIYAELATVANPEWLHAKVRHQLRSRINWRSLSPQVSYDD